MKALRPEWIDHSIEDNSKDHIPSGILGFVRIANIVVSFLGMFSLGLLAMLITIEDMKKRHENYSGAVILRILAFVTTILGKGAIVLHFNWPKLRKGLIEIYRNGWIEFFKVKQPSIWSYIELIITTFLSLNATIFWAGLVPISFKESSDFLYKLDSDTGKLMAPHVEAWYVFIWFAFCSFYANWLTWPSVFQAAFQQKKKLLQWCLESPQYRSKKYTVFNKIQYNARKLLQELKKIQENDEFLILNTPYLNQLLLLLDLNRSSTNKIDDLLTYLESENDPQKLREALFDIDIDKVAPFSRKEFYLKHSFALFVSAVAIVGFRNILGLSDKVWGQWGMKSVARYGARYLAYYATAEMILQTVYPITLKISALPKNGKPVYAFPTYQLVITLFTVVFVGVFAGLSNGEQGVLDNESGFSIILAVFASFALDSFAIYTIGRNIFETRIAESKSRETKLIRNQQLLRFQNLTRAACDKDSISTDQWKSLIEEEGCSNSSDQIFRFWEKPLRKCFGIKEETQEINFNVYI